jgi:hypothetical protein
LVNESLVEKSYRVRDQNETLRRRKRTENIEEKEAALRPAREVYVTSGTASVV